MANKGIVYVLDGAGGVALFSSVVMRVLSALPYEVQRFNWGVGFGKLLSDLTNRSNIEARAVELSRLISDYHNKNVGHQVFIVAKSAGSAVALMSLVDLPPESVERVILLSPAVSPSFNLDQVLHAVRRDLVSFWSPLDLLFLGWGTMLFGTADGVRGKSAGLTGFKTNGDPIEKLKQIKWQPSMMKFFNFGDHWGTSMPPFIRHYVLPLVADS
jgi:alpha-beta hydrolase superfamily lysophospholipase